MTSINASLEQHVAQLGGLNALKADLERPRYSNLMRACSRGDMFYLVMHQLFCLWSLNRTPVHSVVTSLRPGTTDPTWVDKGFDALSKILRSNNDLDQAHVQWFARFPYSEGMQPVYTPTAKLLLKFLEPLAFRWHAMLREASARQFPITAHEMIYVLHCLSPIMRSALFTVSRRSLGIPDNIAKPIIDLFEEEEAVEQQSLTQAPGNIGQLRDRFVTTYKLRVTYCRQRASSATSSPAQSRRPSMQAMQLHRSSSGSMPSATTPGHVQHSPHPGQHPSAGAGWTMPAVPPQHILGPSPSNTPMQSPGMPPPQPGQPFGQPQHHGQPQYGQPQHGQPQYGQSQYGHPQHGQPQYGQPQNVQSQHTWARGDQPVEQQLYQMIQSHHTLSQQGTPNQHQQMHTAYQPPHQQVPHQSPHQQPQHQQFQQPQHSHNMSGGQVMAAQQQAHGQAITNRGGFSSPMEYQSQPMPLPGPASPAIPHPANRSPATTAQTQTPNGASGSGSGNGSQQARSFRPIHEYEYPAGPFDWSSFRIAAHLTRPRSPQRVPAEGTSLQRHYQYVSGFAVNPTRIDAETGLRWLEFSLDDDDVANLPSKYVGISGLPTRSFFHGCTRYRLRCCVLSKESVFSSSEEEENAQQEQGGPLRVRRTDWVVKETRWPGEVYVFINDQPVDTAYRQHFHHDLPTELSDHVVPGRNVVQLSVPASATNRFKGPGADDKTYFFAVERILTASHSKLRRAIKANPHISEAETRADIIRRTAQAPDDDDIIIEDRTLRIGVTDPFSSVLFDVPVRGVACRHLECFDLDNWLNSRTSKPPDKTGHEPCAVDSWRCPICGKDARPSSLRIDDYFVAVRRELLEKGLKRTRTIRGATDGSWTAVPEAHDDSDADDAEEYAGLAPGPAAQATKAAASGTTDSNAVTRTTETNADSITVAVPNGDTATATPDAGDKRDSQAAIEVIEIDD